LEDREAIARTSRGVEVLREMVAGEKYTCAEAERRTGVPADTIRQLARDLAAAPSAAVYGRIGTCRGRHGTLTVFLLDALNSSFAVLLELLVAGGCGRGVLIT
jgi:formate dehydrogenase